MRIREPEVAPSEPEVVNEVTGSPFLWRIPSGPVRCEDRDWHVAHVSRKDQQL